MIRQIIALVFVAIAAVIYIDAKSRHEPYASCEKLPSETEKRNCRNAVDLALSAGW